MRIVKRGEKPEDKVYRGTCLRCHTEIEFMQFEATYVPDQREGDYLSIHCPVCSAVIIVQA